MSHAQLYPASLNITAYSEQNIQQITRTRRRTQGNVVDTKEKVMQSSGAVISSLTLLD